MKIRYIFACMAAICMLAALVYADTTFSWSKPGQKGVLTYTDVALDGGTLTDTTNAGSFVVSETLDVNGAMTATNITLDNGATLDADDCVIGLDNGTLNGTNATYALNASTVSGSVTASGAWDFNAAITATNITLDTGSTLAAKTLTATAVTVSGDVTATNATATFNTSGLDDKSGNSGYFAIGSSTQLWFRSGNTTNVLDYDITN